MNQRLEVIPVPQEVIDRQATIRHAREMTQQMYGSSGPYHIETHEYAYFVSELQRGSYPS